MKNKLVVKTERDIEKQLGIKTENPNVVRGNVPQSVTVSSTNSTISWVQEKQSFIDKIVSLKTENQSMFREMNEKRNELTTVSKSIELLEKRLKERKDDFDLKAGELRSELSKSIEKAEFNQNKVTDLKRENQLLIAQIKQFKSTFVERKERESDVQNGDATEENSFEVENLLKDKLISKTERFYLVRWKGFDSSHDSWERESNLCCPDILKKYKKLNKKH